MATVTDEVKRSDKADGGKVFLSADRVYDLNADKTQDTINSEVDSAVEDLQDIAGDGQLSGFTATDLTGAANELKNTLNHLEDGLAIIVNGDACTTAVPVGGYAYIKNNTHGLAEGLYTNTSASAFPASGGTANSSVFTAVSGGGLNNLKDSLLTVDSYSSGNVNVSKNGKTVFLTWGSVTLDSDGKTFTTVLPVRFQPSREVTLPSKCYNGSTYVDCRVLVTTSGVISLTDFSNKKIDNIQPAFFQTSPVVYCSK